MVWRRLKRYCKLRSSPTPLLPTAVPDVSHLTRMSFHLCVCVCEGGLSVCVGVWVCLSVCVCVCSVCVCPNLVQGEYVGGRNMLEMREQSTFIWYFKALG